MEQRFRARLVHGHVADVQPLAGEVVHERLRALVREHPLHLLLQHRRVAERLLHGKRQQLVVRNAAPQEERQPRRQIEIADAIRRIGRAFGGWLSMRNRNFGLIRMLRMRHLDARFESAACRAARDMPSAAPADRLRSPGGDTRGAPASR